MIHNVSYSKVKNTNISQHEFSTVQIGPFQIFDLLVEQLLADIYSGCMNWHELSCIALARVFEE